MDKRYDILKSISQGKDGTMSEENADLVRVANVIRRATTGCVCNETELCTGISIADLNEAEKRAAEEYAKKENLWLPISDVFSLGLPGPSGSESDTFLADTGHVYKTNNLLHCGDSIVSCLNRFAIFNMVFFDSAYTFVGFTGFDGRSVFPIVRQAYIKEGKNATQNEIDCYMAALGFDKVENGKFVNNQFLVWDLFPKNVLKDSTGDIFVIDAEITLR